MKNKYFRELLGEDVQLIIKIGSWLSSVCSVDVLALDRKQRSLIGYAISLVGEEKKAWLLDIFVSEGRRRAGIGSKMLELLLDYFQDGLATYVYGCDLPDNSEELNIAISFYLHNNFLANSEQGSVGRELVKSDSDFFSKHCVTVINPKCERDVF
jgi:GNAT superfamily N-acetyltransferase